MPIYEYECATCRDTFEKLVFGKEDVCCPKCGSEVKRLMSCCSFKTGGASDYGSASSSGSGKSGCSGCSATSCATCH
jgi:putative FmdB family regulatory protein